MRLYLNLISAHLPQISTRVIPESLLTGNPALSTRNHGSPVKTFRDNALVAEDER
jgi:hypothetical protein